MPRPSASGLPATEPPGPQAAFAAALTAAEGRARLGALGLAVSGGGDSMALMLLARDWAGARGVSLKVATVDHGLRPEAAEEARMVAGAARELGLSHDILTWDEAPGRGNLQDAARQARYRLLADWAGAQGLDAVALGHTLDDQAETFLARLARGSGVDGLAAMRDDWHRQGMRWLRPLLTVRRGDLRDFLTGRGVGWVEDPSNDDPRFQRVRARRALAALAPLGLDAPTLAATAARLTQARVVLARAAFEAAGAVCRVEAGDVRLAAAAFDLPEETRFRLFAHALGWVASARYRPRLNALAAALAAVRRGEARALHGCLIRPEPEGQGGGVRICREYQAVRSLTAAPGRLWDNRWRLRGPDRGCHIRALGAAIADCPDWRATGRPRMALMADPAVFREGVLIAAPLAGLARGWQAEFSPIGGDFAASLLSH